MPLYHLKNGKSGVQPKKVCRYCGTIGRIEVSGHKICHKKYEEISEQILKERNQAQIKQAVKPKVARSALYKQFQEMKFTEELMRIVKSILHLTFNKNEVLFQIGAVKQQYFEKKVIENGWVKYRVYTDEERPKINLEGEIDALRLIFKAFTDDDDVEKKRTAVTLLKNALERSTYRTKKQIHIGELREWTQEGAGSLYGSLRYIDSTEGNMAGALRSMGTTEPETYLPNKRTIKELKKNLARYPKKVQEIVQMFDEAETGIGK